MQETKQVRMTCLPSSWPASWWGHGCLGGTPSKRTPTRTMTPDHNTPPKHTWINICKKENGYGTSCHLTPKLSRSKQQSKHQTPGCQQCAGLFGQTTQKSYVSPWRPPSPLSSEERGTGGTVSGNGFKDLLDSKANVRKQETFPIAAIYVHSTCVSKTETVSQNSPVCIPWWALSGADSCQSTLLYIRDWCNIVHQW